ncbi:unnamed protein product [Wuchereria bancrofti]|nr:unnamed protein product [Wuchereria bancrofti]
MSLRDQRIWMTNLANVIQNSQWITTAGQACRHQSLHFISIPSEHLSLEEPQFELHPPETNPPENHGFSKLRHRTRRSRFFDDSANYRRSDYNNSYMDHFSNRRMNWTSNRGFFDTNHYFVPSYRRNPRSYDEKKVSYIGRPNSIYRLNVRSRTSANSDFKNGELTNTDRAGATNSRSRLVKPICDRNPNLFGAKDNFNKLVQTMEVIEHEERDKHGSKKNVDKKQEQVQKKEQQREEKDTRKEKEELLEGNASPKKTKKHPVEDREGSSSGHHNTERDHQLVSPRDDTTVSSVVGAQLQLEIAFKNEIVICSSSNDVESIAVGMASHDKQNDLIHFSDSELENDLLSEAEILM